MNDKRGVTFAVITALLWGMLAIGVKIVLNEVSAITVVWVRMSIAALGMALYFAFKDPAAFSVFTREHFIRRQKWGFLLAFVGLVFFYQKQIASMDVGQETFLKGVLATLGGAVAWSMYSIAQKILVRTYPVQRINLFIYTFSAIVYAPFVDFSVFLQLSPWMWVGLLFLGLNTLVAYGSMGEALKYTDAGKVSVIVILNPILTFILLELMEYFRLPWLDYTHIPFWAYLGALMMLSGAVLATLRAKKKS